MPSGRDVYTSKWLKADDLGDDEVTFTIVGSGTNTFKEQNGAEKTQLTLTFKETAKEFGLNVTNYRVLESIFKSDETEDWHGYQVVLFVTQTTMTDGRAVDCLRVKKKTTEKLFAERQKGRQRQAVAPEPARTVRPSITSKVQPLTQEEVDEDDSIPF
jgi:hypothetical protein